MVETPVCLKAHEAREKATTVLKRRQYTADRKNGSSAFAEPVGGNGVQNSRGGTRVGSSLGLHFKSADYKQSF